LTTFEASWHRVQHSTGIASEQRERIELLQGTLDLIVLHALATMGPQHAYGLAARLQQVTENPFPLNQGTLYVALIRLEQRGWIEGEWGRTDSNREAKYYAITTSGRKALDRQVARWRRLAGFVNQLLLDEG
jgi:PadR family transcriptional regulator